MIMLMYRVEVVSTQALSWRGQAMQVYTYQPHHLCKTAVLVDSSGNMVRIRMLVHKHSPQLRAQVQSHFCGFESDEHSSAAAAG
jgi:hypothetical protein